MDKNRIECVAEQGERARNRKALVIKAGEQHLRRLKHPPGRQAAKGRISFVNPAG